MYFGTEGFTYTGYYDGYDDGGGTYGGDDDDDGGDDDDDGGDDDDDVLLPNSSFAAFATNENPYILMNTVTSAVGKQIY